MSNARNIAAIAERLAHRGLAVFPCSPSKVPLTEHGHRDASTDAERIRDWWQNHPQALIAVATGARSNASALDLDRQHGAAVWWHENRHRLPETRTHRTRSGGLHLWLRHRDCLRCSTAKIAAGVDIKAEGGACIWWPCIGLPVLSDAPLAPWPDWLMPPPPAPPTPPPAPAWHNTPDAARRYAEAAMRNAIARVAGAAPGTRNDTLFAQTAGLLRLVEGGAVTANEIAGAMTHAAYAARLDRTETARTIASALKAGGV